MTNRGASTSFGPPLGLPFLAHCVKDKIRTIKKRENIFFNSPSLLQINNIFFGLSSKNFVNFYSVKAMVAMLIFTLPAFNNSLEQASKVAPVVMTSSIKSRCLFWMIFAL